MRERECGNCHEFHEQDRCQKCGGFLRCEPTREEPEPPEEVIWPSGRRDRYHYTRYERTCSRCGDANEWIAYDHIETLSLGAGDDGEELTA